MKYKITYQKEQKLHTIIIVISNNSELKNHKDYPENIISIKRMRNFSINVSFLRNNKKDIYELFSQLDIMLSANLSFHESIDLLLKSKQEKIIENILIIIKDSLSSSLPIDKSLSEYKKYLGSNTLLFLKLGFENGNIKESVHSLVEILEEDMVSNDKLKDVMRYPTILIVSLIISIAMIFIYVLPNFDFIFSLLEDDIPLATKVLLTLKDILSEYTLVIVFVGLGVTGIFLFLMKKFRYFFDKIILLHLPIVSKVFQSYHFYRLFLSISIIVKSKYQFQVAVLNSKNIVNNLYVQEVMDLILANIKNGASIADAFDKSALFDSLTIKLLYTAEYTNQYESVLLNITAQHKKRFHKSLQNFSSSIEPILIFFIALIVLWLILAIMLPIWNLGSVIN